jgi:hypothetical protein
MGATTDLKREIIKAFDGYLPEVPLNWNPTLPDPNVDQYEFWYEPELSTTLDLYTKRDGITTIFTSTDLGNTWDGGEVELDDEGLWDE